MRHERPWRWTSRRSGLRTLIRAHGLAAVATWTQNNVATSARKQGWRASETAAALAGWQRDVEDVAAKMREHGEDVEPANKTPLTNEATS